MTAEPGHYSTMSNHPRRAARTRRRSEPQALTERNQSFVARALALSNYQLRRDNPRRYRRVQLTMRIALLVWIAAVLLFAVTHW